MENKTKRTILDLCGGTGSWSKPYKNAGYDVKVITLPEYDVKNYNPPKNVYGVLAAPPCTHFSLARTRAKTPRDLVKGLEIVLACLKIIKKAKPKFWALENPKGLLVHYLGKPDYIFSPEEFGDRYSKKTYLWGNFNKPIKNPVQLTSEEIKRCKNNTRILPAIKGLSISDRRSITPEGFANAFFNQNK